MLPICFMVHGLLFRVIKPRTELTVGGRDDYHQRHDPDNCMSKMAVHGDTIYFCRAVGFEAHGASVEEQVEYILALPYNLVVWS